MTFLKSLHGKHFPKKVHFCEDFVDNEMKASGVLFLKTSLTFQ